MQKNNSTNPLVFPASQCGSESNLSVRKRKGREKRNRFYFDSSFISGVLFSLLVLAWTMSLARLLSLSWFSLLMLTVLSLLDFLFFFRNQRTLQHELIFT